MKNHIKRHTLFSSYSNCILDITLSLLIIIVSVFTIYGFYLAHLWFVSIHPYDDGNGRISRAIADYTLSHDTKEEYKIYSMSTAIYARRAAYYDILDMTTNLHKNRHYDFTLWVEWNIDILISALERSHESILFIIKKLLS